MIHVFAGIALAVLILNGLRVVIGIPPISYWRGGRRCPVCEGVGYLRAHSHTGEIVDIPITVSDAADPAENQAGLIE